MTKCKDLKYERFCLEDFKAIVEPQIAAAERAETFDELMSAREKVNAASSKFATMSALANARYTLDTRNEYYVGEVEYYDNVAPVANELLSRFGKTMLADKFKDKLSETLSPALVKSLENQQKAVSPKIIEDKQKEAGIVMEYSKLMSTMPFEFRGKTLPLSVVRGYLSDNDRTVRKDAAFSIGRGLEKHRDELDDIFDRLVKVRDGMGKKLGYDNFVALGYLNMDRKDYGKSDVEAFRNSVQKYLVPVVSELKNSLGKELKFDKFMFYDNSVTLAGGETKPKLAHNEMFEAAQKMYDDLNPEVGAFMRFMRESGAFDVEARDGKWGGGYCTEFYDFVQPFILANWNGSCDDVDVLTHEFGHAFASMNAMKHGIFELSVGGMETAECHSMTMELMCHPYMDKFFGADADKYRYRHLFKNIDFIPYGVIVDEFQHVVYENPNLTPAERNKAFKELTAKYMPYMTYEGIPYLEEGTRWQYQMHIYESPFYYIDYCLAQTVALEFYAQSLKDHDKALANYIAFTKKGGSKMFKTLVSEAGLASPFEPDALKEVAAVCLKELKEIKKRIK
ncbi:MAG: M3 family oligoendopeptidase [Clostridia bacterium]|nr:M3 family oligoendopeptidase [Clostridia bacterium]